MVAHIGKDIAHSCGFRWKYGCFVWNTIAPSQDKAWEVLFGCANIIGFTYCFDLLFPIHMELYYMFTVLLYIFLPLVFLIHDLEEIMMRKRSMPEIERLVSSKFPRIAPIIRHLQNISTRNFIIIVIEEFFLILVALGVFFYGIPYPLLTLFWGFCIHLFVHIAQSIVIRRYVPGLITSLLFLPYCALGSVHLIQRYSFELNMLLAVIGFVIVVANLLIMHRIMRK